jgi:hypothetical protein
MSNTTKNSINWIKIIISTALWISPILKLIQNTRDAVSDGYDESLVTDPGHVRIKYFDKIIITISWIVALIIIVPSYFHYSKIYSDDQIIPYVVILFPYFSGIWVTVILYINSIFLSLYNNKREYIIRSINEKMKVW